LDSKEGEATLICCSVALYGRDFYGDKPLHYQVANLKFQITGTSPYTTSCKFEISDYGDKPLHYKFQKGG